MHGPQAITYLPLWRDQLGLNVPRCSSCDVSLSLTPKPNIRRQRYEARCPRRPASLVRVFA
jgi:hypothetical protein